MTEILRYFMSTIVLYEHNSPKQVREEIKKKIRHITVLLLAHQVPGG